MRTNQKYEQMVLDTFHILTKTLISIERRIEIGKRILDKI